MAAGPPRAGGGEAALIAEWLPRLHVVTDDGILARDEFLDTAERLLERGRARIAFHLRGHATPGKRLFDLAAALARSADETAARLLVNDRIDIALAVGAAGVQLGRRSIPLERARRLLGERWIGYSAHDADASTDAARRGTDFVVLGTIYATASHPEVEPGGLARVRETARAAEVPIVAIGGVLPRHVPELVGAGAHGVAVVGGIWNAGDPCAGLDDYLAALGYSEL